MYFLKSILIKRLPKKFSLIHSEKVVISCLEKSYVNLHVREYRNISHGPPPIPLSSTFFYGFCVTVFLCCVFDVKSILGLRDEEKELQELIDYTFPDDIFTYSEMPQNHNSQP